MVVLPDLRVKIFADGADLAMMLSLYKEPFIKGFTTNPTLMRKWESPTTTSLHARRCRQFQTDQSRSKYSPTMSTAWGVRRG
jgi:transaldolase